MRAAVFLLLWVLVVTMATQVDGWWWCGCRKRRRQRKKDDSCKAQCGARIGKRSVLDIMIPGDEPHGFSKQWQTLLSSVSKSRSKRALKKLKFPSDCLSSKLQNFARKCGLCVTPGGSHIKICAGSSQITTIPHHVKDNGTCRNIINILNGRCL